MQGTDGACLVLSFEFVELRFVDSIILFFSKKIDYCCIFFANFITNTY